MKKFLIVEDDELTSIGFAHMLSEYGEVITAYTFAEAIKYLGNDTANSFDIIFIDLDLEQDLLGLELVYSFAEKGAYCVVVSAREDDQHIEKAYLNGCKDYLSKPFRKDSLKKIVKKQQFYGQKDMYLEIFQNSFVTKNKEMLAQLENLHEVILTDGPITIKGPTGTGKTLLAKLIHQVLFDESSSFIHLNCAEIPEDLIESELFGHEKGAFSGAEKSKPGMLELADGGILFLDEIATMPMALQQKLLKAIDEKTFYRLGAITPVHSNFRLVSATCEDLEEMVLKKKFREDLYFRILGHSFTILPLFKRREDIKILIKHFLKTGKRKIVLSQEVYDVFNQYLWPGNIRELKKQINLFSAKADGIVTLQDIPLYMLQNIHPCLPSETVGDQDRVVAVEEIEISTNGEVLEDRFISDKLISLVESKGLKPLIEKVEEEVISKFFDKNNNKVRKTLEDLKISNNLFYKVMGRLKK